MKLLAMRIQECQARSTPGTVGRDGDTASPDRQRRRGGAEGGTESEADQRASELMRNAGIVPPPVPAMAGQGQPMMPTMPMMPGWQPPMPPYGMPHGGAGGGNGFGMWGGGWDRHRCRHPSTTRCTR